MSGAGPTHYVVTSWWADDSPKRNVAVEHVGTDRDAAWAAYLASIADYLDLTPAEVAERLESDEDTVLDADDSVVFHFHEWPVTP